jgi:plastocyanin
MLTSSPDPLCVRELEVCVTTSESEKVLNRWLQGSIACIATGVMLSLAGPVLQGTPIEQAARGVQTSAAGLHFVRIGDAPDGGNPAAAGATQVVVDNFSFTPAMAAVPVGTTVTWTNHDDIPHNVVSPEQKFKSPVLDTDEMFSHTFDAAGTYKYYCSIHPRMTGQVVVR